MLRTDVVDAVKEGEFHIYPVKTIDEGVEILTGIEAGRRLDDGSFEEGTVHFLVDQELQRLAKGLKAFSESEDRRGDKNEDSEPAES